MEVDQFRILRSTAVKVEYTDVALAQNKDAGEASVWLVPKYLPTSNECVSNGIMDREITIYLA